MWLKNFPFSKVTIALSFLIVVFVSSNLNWGKDHWKGIVGADGKGYYAYLPAVFIYQDLNFGFFEEIEQKKYYDKNLYYDYRSSYNGKVINKYYCGTAMVQTPFFLMAHFLSSISDYEADGYSKLYAVFVNIAALFYFLVGLIYFFRLLKSYQINDKIIAFTLIATVFGTHLFYYTVGQPSMSHVFSFSFITMFLFYGKKYFSEFRKKHLLLLFVIMGIIVLIRPVNALVILFLPFLAGSMSQFKKGMVQAFQSKANLIMGLVLMLAIGFIQLAFYKISTGSFIVYSYDQEGFNFTSPEMINILFSYKKGLFLYTPMLLLALAGSYYLWKKSTYSLISWWLFFISITYVFSSWWMWYYGGSFSSRVYIEFIPVFMILFALFLQNCRKGWMKKTYASLAVLLIIVCQIQTFQYRYFHIHWVDMDKEKYWDVFMRVDRLIDKN